MTTTSLTNQVPGLSLAIRMKRIGHLPQYADMEFKLIADLASMPNFQCLEIIGEEKSVCAKFSDNSSLMIMRGHSSISPSLPDYVSDREVKKMSLEQRQEFMQNHGYWVGLSSSNQYKDCARRYTKSYQEYNDSRILADQA